MLSKTGRRAEIDGVGAAEFAHELLEPVAAIRVAAKLIEAGEARAQQNLVAGIRQFRRAAHRLGEARTARVRDTKSGAMKRQLGARLADQHG